MKRTSRVLIAILFVGVLSACASIQANIERAQATQAQRKAAFDASRPVCRTDQQCAVMWATARNWVVNTCGMKIQSITDGYIETFNSPNMSLFCRVTKDPQMDGGWVLTVTTGCGNMFGCSPDSWEAAFNFNQVVSASAPPVLLGPLTGS